MWSARRLMIPKGRGLAMSTKTLAFEIGTEELPAFDLHAATIKLEGIMGEALDAANIAHGAIRVYSTPRRLIMVVADVPEQTEAFEEVFRGPATRIAFDDQGKPTKAASGFARGKGVSVEDLEVREVDGTEYVFAVKSVAALRVADVLPALLEGVISAIPWPKTQRWGSRSEQFSRPVRWLFAMLGDEVVPVAYAGLLAGSTTRGHRFLSPGPHEVACADALIAVLRDAYIIPSEEEREAVIREQVAEIERQTGLRAELPAKTMAEVVNLAEYPTAMMGTFDELFLAVPKEITVDAMLVHQRYFPLFNQDGTLANKFIITSNGDPAYRDNIVDGNQRVVAARLYDAKFFYDEDLKRPLESYVEGLASVVFQEKLGTTLAKTNRVRALAAFLADAANLTAQERDDAVRAAYLCKADLVTGAVVEFTSVQGIMGSYYAKAAGETDAVAEAIADHYRPRFSGDNPPASRVGKVVAVADKLDTICGLFSIGQGPTGSSDPFALRRAALGIVTMLLGEDALAIDLVSAIDTSLSLYEADGIAFDAAEARAAIIDFFITRTKVMLRDAGSSADSIDAVLASGVDEPVVLVDRVRALESARANEPDTFGDLAVAYARANNLREDEAGVDFDEALLTEVEHALSCAVVQAENRVSAALSAGDYASALVELASLRKPIDLFFDRVMVMDDNPAIRANHMKLLNRFVAVFAHVADFGKMAKSSK